MSLTVAEFCAGYNGLGMAVEAVFGAEPGWFSEYDAAPSKILAHRYPDVRNYGDMTKIKWAPDCPSCGTMCAVYRHADDSPYYWCGLCGVEWDVSIRHDDPNADIIPEPADIHSGGTPCQDLSHAGRRAGMNEGTRSNLWVNMREAIAIQRPKWVVWENVRGAYSACADSEMGQCPGCMDGRSPHRPFLRALGRVLGDLSDLGYDTQWRGLRASDVGACHGRFRVFVLARRRGPAGNANFPDVEGGRTPGRSNADPQQSPWADRSAGDGYQNAADAYRLGYERGWQARGRRLGLADGGKPAAYAHDATRDRKWARPESWEGSEAASDAPDHDIDGSAGIGAADRGPRISWGDYEPAVRRWEARLGRPAPRPTEPTGRAGGERLSPRFTEWMMGLPDGWVTDPAIGISRNDQLKACGNGVVPQQAVAALQDMLRAFQAMEAAA